MKRLKDMTEEEKKKIAEDYVKMMEAKLKKSEKRTWMVKDLDHLKDHH